MISKIDKNSVRKARHFRTRRYISGTQERPRLNVYRSLNNIYVQIIDDVAGNTIASASTLDAEVKAQLAGKTKKEAANIVGEVAGRLRRVDRPLESLAHELRHKAAVVDMRMRQEHAVDVRRIERELLVVVLTDAL